MKFFRCKPRTIFAAFAVVSFIVGISSSGVCLANDEIGTETGSNSDSTENRADKVVERKITIETTDGDKKHTAVCKQTVRVSSNVPISCISPHAACEESKVVIDVLMKIAKAYTEGDFDVYGSYLDKEVTIFDDTSKKLIAGKEKVLEYCQRHWKEAHTGPQPVLSYKIEHPYARVTGDTAVVTFKATKQVGGDSSPGTYVSKCTDIFIKRDGQWKKLHYVSHWKKVKS